MKAPVDVYKKQLTDGPNTKGVGAQLMDPTILPDGTKQFRLTAAITDWEVSPGKTVKAWTYNGTVPGPTIRVNPGDHVQVVLDNQLPQSTAIHFHGITVPNAMDGVPDVTQPPVKPGESFTYDFVAASNPEVGHVPLAPSRRAPGARRSDGCLPDRRRAASRGRDRGPAGADGAERRRRHRPHAEREVVPRHRAR